MIYEIIRHKFLNKLVPYAFALYFFCVKNITVNYKQSFHKRMFDWKKEYFFFNLLYL